jgi:hypothetical protein
MFRLDTARSKQTHFEVRKRIGQRYVRLGNSVMHPRNPAAPGGAYSGKA